MILETYFPSLLCSSPTVRLLPGLCGKDITFSITFPTYNEPSPSGFPRGILHFLDILCAPHCSSTATGAAESAFHSCTVDFSNPVFIFEMFCVNTADSLNTWRLKGLGLCNQIKEQHSKIPEHLFFHLYSNFIDSKRVKQAQTHVLFKLRYRQCFTYFVTTVMIIMPIINKNADRFLLR